MTLFILKIMKSQELKRGISIKLGYADTAFYKTKKGEGNFHGSMGIWENNKGFMKYCQKSPLPYFAAQLLNSKKIN